MRYLKRILLFITLIVVVAFAAINLLAYNHARSMMHFTNEGPPTKCPEDLSLGEKMGVLFSGINIPRPNKSSTISDSTFQYEHLIIPASNGVTLGAWYAPAEGNRPLVILFHGYAVDKAKLLAEAESFREMNCSVLLIDFRGSGQSSESYTTIGYDEADDVVSTTRFADERLPRTRLILYGQSMGGAAVLRAAGVLGVKPDAIIIEAVFDRLINTVRNRFKMMGVPSFPAADLLVFWGGRQAGFNGFSHNPVDYATGVSCPVLFIHGTNDLRASPDEARQVYSAVSGPKSFVEFPGAGHESCLSQSPDRWKEAVGAFLGGLNADQR